jgi:hypothetical protein
VGVSGVEMDVVGALSTFCEKASTVSNGEVSPSSVVPFTKDLDIVGVGKSYCA